jgi:ElaB/YqjD/DUF883 family membrane-anchored ribosome-binding protein
MDDQNKGMKERWAPGSPVPERGYTNDPGFSSGVPDTDRPYRDDAAVGDDRDDDRDPTRRTREIRSEIDRTRTEMSGTIDAIQDRLNPRNVVSRAAENVRDATVGRAREFAHHVQDSVPGFGNRGGVFVDRLRENPFAAAVAGASLAWLVFGGRRRASRDYGRAIYGSTRGSEPYIRETSIDLASDDDAAMSTQRSQGFGASERLGHTMHSARARLQDAGTDTMYRARRVTEQYPFAGAAIAATVGLAIGLMLPETERENQIMGEARDSLIEKGRDTVRDAAEKVKETAGEVQKVATRALGATEPDSSTGKGAGNPNL